MKCAEFQSDDLEFHERLGSGSFGTVYRAIWKSANKEVAVKKLLTLGDEAQVLSVLSHKHIIQFYGAVVTAPNYCLVTEYARHGSLYDYIADKKLDFQQILAWSKQIALGISYLHNEAPFKIIHRDLKSKNVVITADMVVKLCDFGSSRYFHQTTKMSIAGTYPWMAPEVIQAMPVSESCDTFSYGVVLWEMLTGEVPFKGFDGVQVQYLVVVREERLAIPSSCPEKFGTLLKSCWLTEPKQRPSFKEIQFLLHNMCNDEILVDETNSFIQNKNEWKKEMEKTFQRLKNVEINLTTKEKELRERELRLLQKEQSLNVVKMLNKTDLNDWEVNDVYLWVKQLGNEAVDLLQYAQIFFDNHINGKRIQMLTTQDLFEMGITSFGHRKELMYQISKLVEELAHLTHFPPLHPSPSIESETSNQRKVQLTLLFGNHCRLGTTPMDHKWKVYVEVDGDEEALNAIKDVQLTIKEETLTLTAEPYVMPKWFQSGDSNSPIFVQCLVTYQNYIKKPRTTRHTHEVLMKKGGSVVQKTIELLVKQSASIVSLPDEGYSTASPTLTRNSSSRYDRLSTTSINSAFNSISEEPAVSWANRVKGQSPKTFMPRVISEANKEVLLRNREIASSPSLYKRCPNGERSPSLPADSERKRLSSEFSAINVSSAESKSELSDTVTSGITFTVKEREDKSDAESESAWTVVKSSKDHKLSQKKQQAAIPGFYRNPYQKQPSGKSYYRSQSDQNPRKDVDSRRYKNAYSEGDRYNSVGRGRGSSYDNRGRGSHGNRGRGRGSYQNSRGHQQR